MTVFEVISEPGWTPERIETARALWLEGKSASEIMRNLRRLCGFSTWPTRSAVIGKINRMGVGGSKGTHPRAIYVPVGEPRPKRTIRLTHLKAPIVKRDRSNPLGPHSPSEIKRRAIEVRTFELPSEPEPDGPVVPLLALESHHCRWPIGSPSDPNFGFCGKRRAEGQTYCPSCIKTRKPYLPTPPLNKFNPDAPRARRSA